MNEINNSSYRDPAVATMLASLGSTADAGAAGNASPAKGPGGVISNMQGVLGQLNQIVATLGALAQSSAAGQQVMPQQPGSAGAQNGASAMGQLPPPLQQLVNAALAFASQTPIKAQPPLATAGAPTQSATGSAPKNGAAPPTEASTAKQFSDAGRQAVDAVKTQEQSPFLASGVKQQPPSMASGVKQQPPSTAIGVNQQQQPQSTAIGLNQPQQSQSTAIGVKQQPESMASGVKQQSQSTAIGVKQQPESMASGVKQQPPSTAIGVNQQQQPQSTAVGLKQHESLGSIQKQPENNTLKAAAKGTGESQQPMSQDRAMRVLADNFPEIQADKGIKLADLTKIARGETVNGMSAAPSALLRQAAKTFADDPKAFGEFETRAEHATGNKKAKGDGVLGLEDLSYNLNGPKALGAGEKEAVQTLDKHKAQLFGKNDKIDVSVLKSVADTGKLPDGKAAPADLKAAAERVTSSPWLMAKLDTGDSASQGKWDVRANGEISKKDLGALSKQDGKVSADQPQDSAKLGRGVKVSDGPGASATDKPEATTVSTLVQQAKAAFGDNAKAVLEAATKAENGEKLDPKTRKAVDGIVTAATEAFGDAKTAAAYLGDAAKRF
jgi:hypothetical protein